MSTYTFKIGQRTVPLVVDDGLSIRVLRPQTTPSPFSEERILKDALAAPIGSKPLSQIAKPGERVVIVTSDITRPMPSARVLPLVIDALEAGGVKPRDITLVLALGSHRAHTEAEREALVGKAVLDRGVAVFDSDSQNCVRLGYCDNQTPVDIDRRVAAADRIVALGNIEYHYFAGYSGGAKALMPGVSSWAAIEANHKNMTDPRSRAGALDDNPVRQDIDQVADFLPIDFCLNVILNPDKQIVAAVAGHVIDAHRLGCKKLDALYGLPLTEPADIVVVSAGGHPKDINLYQAQKALDNAKHALAPGGIVILLASASEGFGEDTFGRWMQTKTPEEMIRDLNDRFVLGGHKATAIAKILRAHTVYMVSDADPKALTRAGFVPFDDLQTAFDTALAHKGGKAKVLLMPVGSSTLPLLNK